MKDIRRSRRLRLPRRRQQLTKPITSDNDDESDLEHERSQRKTIARTNQNANRIATTLFEPISMFPIEEKQHQARQIPSDQSSLLLYSINSVEKPVRSSDDLTLLTRTGTNTTSLSALTYSHTKQTEMGTVKIDLTDLSGTDTLESSITSSDLDQSLSFDRKPSLVYIDHQMKTTKSLTRISGTDTSLKSVVFTKDYSLDQERSSHKHTSCLTISNLGNGDCTTMASPNVTTPQQPSMQWNLQNMTGKMKLLIGCSSLGFIAGILILVIIL